MTDRERQFAALGFEYAEGIDLARVVIVPSTGREIRRTDDGLWEAQPHNDNYWRTFTDLLDAARFALGHVYVVVYRRLNRPDRYLTSNGIAWDLDPAKADRMSYRTAKLVAQSHGRCVHVEKRGV